jgi:tRNA/rRNA methyltransferase
MSSGMIEDDTDGQPSIDESPVQLRAGQGRIARAPVVGTPAREIGDIIDRAHEEGVQAVLAGPNALTQGELEAALTYCAKQWCVIQQATCAGCRLRIEAEGITNLDEYVARQGTITTRKEAIVLEGRGGAQRDVESLEWLARHWQGEEYWYWARRVLRKLRYGVRHVDDLIDDRIGGPEAPSVLLMEPQIPENIGMVARAMGNFGMSDLRVIAPRDGWPSEKARAVASGAAAIIDDARLEPSLDDAIKDLHWVAATTARQRDLRKPVMTPEQAANEMRRRSAAGQRCGVLFGRERHGLQSSEVAMADAIVMIPVNNRFASLNIAQSVLLLGYEWLKASGGGSLGRVTTYESPVESGLHLGSDRIADKEALLKFFEHIESELELRGFLHPPHRRHVVVRNLRTMFTRMELTDQEVRTLRGIVATLSHGKGKARKGSD